MSLLPSHSCPSYIYITVLYCIEVVVLVVVCRRTLISSHHSNTSYVGREPYDVPVPQDAHGA